MITLGFETIASSRCYVNLLNEGKVNTYQRKKRVSIDESNFVLLEVVVTEIVRSWAANQKSNSMILSRIVESDLSFLYSQ